MKQLLIITIFLASGFCYHVDPQLNAAESTIDPYVFEDLINSTLEGLRPLLPDPIEIDTLVLSLPDEAGALIKGNASISDFKLSGLKGFEVTALNLAIIGTRLNFTLDLPAVDLYTGYAFNLLLASILPISGDGNITVHLEDLEVQASAQASLTGGLSVKNLRLTIYLGDATFDFHGLFDDEDVSALLSAILNDVLAKWIDANQELISDILSPLIEVFINAVLGSLGQTTTPTP